MNAIKSAVFISLLLGMAACGSKNQSQTDGSPSIPASSFLNAQKIASAGSVACKDSSLCNASIGMLTSVTSPTSVESCTTFVIDSQTLATNSHCIPRDLRTSGSSCKGRIWAFFPKMGTFLASQSECDQIIFASDTGNSKDPNADYAFVRMSLPIDRPAMQISREGLKEGQKYDLLKMNPVNHNSAMGEMNKTSCTAFHSSMAAPGSFDDRSSVMALVDCTILRGNSGSPILDSLGQVHGVIQGPVDEAMASAIIYNTHSSLIEGTIGIVNLGTNFACLDIPAANIAQKSEDCEALAKPQDDGKILKISPAQRASFGKILEEDLKGIAGQLDPRFQWKLVKVVPTSRGKKGHLVFAPVPACIVSPSKLAAKYHHFGGGFTPVARLEFDVPTLDFTVGLNRYLVPAYDVEPTYQSVHFGCQFDPKELSITGKASFVLKQLKADKADYTAVLGACKGT